MATKQLPIEQGYKRYVDPIEDLPEEEDLDLSPIPEDAAVDELPDGSAVVHLQEEEEERTPEFAENMVTENVADDPEELRGIVTMLLEAVDRDKQARSKRDEQYAEGIKRTGLGNEAPGGADFQGASRAVHPALVEGCIDYAARAMKELFPAKGPVRTHIVGEQTREKVAKAERKKEYMNWQLTTQIVEYRPELEQCLTQVPLGGSQYMKAWYDERFERPRVEFVPIDDIYVPFAATDFLCSQRTTHRQKVTQQTLEGRIRSGLYRKLPNALVDNAPSMSPEQTESEQATNKIEGKDDLSFNEDGLRDLLEIYVELEFSKDPFSKGKSAPYIITIDPTSQKVFGLYRNWDEKDEKRLAKDWIVEFGFVPWRGAYKIGLAHIIGSLAGATTGALRALLDSAHIQNSPSALKLKGARVAGQNITAEPTQITEIEGPANVDDIRKLAMPFPFPGPSATLFQLLEWATQQAKGVINTAEERIGENTANMPVGTTLALIEQGSITYSSIHARLHESQKRLLAIIHRINSEYLDDEVTVEELGELVVHREDFLGPMDVIPVSDPSIFSETQRYAQLQEVFKLATSFPQFYKLDKLNSRALQLLSFPNPEEVLQVSDDAEDLPPITENFVARKPETTLKAYADQDHIAHLKVHLSFMVSPILCANPVMAMPALGKLLEHCKDHLLEYYQQHANAAAQAVAATQNLEEEAASAEGVVLADQELVRELGPLMGHFEQAAQLAQQFAPKTPKDPRVEVEEMRIQAAQGKAQMDMQMEQMKGQMKAQMEDMKTKTDAFIKQMSEQSETMRHAQEMQIAARNADLAAGQAERQQQYAIHMQNMKDHAAQLAQEATQSMQILLERMKQSTQLELEDVRATNAKAVTILNALLSAQEAADSAATSNPAKSAESAAKVEELRNAVDNMAEAVHLLLSKAGKRRGKVMRDPATGDLVGFELE